MDMIYNERIQSEFDLSSRDASKFEVSLGPIPDYLSKRYKEIHFYSRSILPTMTKVSNLDSPESSLNTLDVFMIPPLSLFNFGVYNVVETINLIKEFISMHQGKEFMILFFFFIRSDEILSIIHALSSEGQLTDIIQTTHTYGLIFQRKDNLIIPSFIQAHWIDKDTSHQCFVDFTAGVYDAKLLNIIDSKKGDNTTPYVFCREKSYDTSTSIGCYWRWNQDGTQIKGKYYGIDYSTPHKARRDFLGDKKMKESVNLFPSKVFNASLVKSPAIIVDVDNYSSIAFLQKNKDTDKYDTTPFVLDDHFLGFRVKADFMPSERDYNRYKTVVDRINKRFGPMCKEIEKKMSDIPGKTYHLNLNEKRYILITLAGTIVNSSLRKVSSESSAMELKPCGFDMKPYLDALEKEGFIKKTDEKGRYAVCKGIMDSSLVLAAFILNDKIYHAYNALSDDEKADWNRRYNYNGWQKATPGTDVRVAKYGWRRAAVDSQKIKDNKLLLRREDGKSETFIPIFNFNGNKKLVLEQGGEGQIKNHYFEQLFSMKGDQITQLRSSALAYTDKVETRELIKLILEVDQEQNRAN